MPTLAEHDEIDLVSAVADASSTLLAATAALDQCEQQAAVAANGIASPGSDAGADATAVCAEAAAAKELAAAALSDAQARLAALASTTPDAGGVDREDGGDTDGATCGTSCYVGIALTVLGFLLGLAFTVYRYRNDLKHNAQQDERQDEMHQELYDKVDQKLQDKVRSLSSTQLGTAAPYMRGKITRAQAEAELSGGGGGSACPVGSFVVRQSTRSPGTHVLSVVAQQNPPKVQHFTLVATAADAPGLDAPPPLRLADEPLPEPCTDIDQAVRLLSRTAVPRLGYKLVLPPTMVLADGIYIGGGGAADLVDYNPGPSESMPHYDEVAFSGGAPHADAAAGQRYQNSAVFDASQAVYETPDATSGAYLEVKSAGPAPTAPPKTATFQAKDGALGRKTSVYAGFAHDIGVSSI